MKTLFICIALLLSAMFARSQSVSYAYDAAGNRTARTFSLIKSPEAPQSPSEITSLTDLIAEKSIVIYPNPTKGNLTVEIKDFTDKLEAEFQLTDLSGRVIANRKATAASQTFDLSNRAAGIYLLLIRINGESVVWRIIKE
jgi:hypothetical protein